MASEELLLHSDPNFAVICSFIQNYADYMDIPQISIKNLTSYVLSSKPKVHRILEDMLIRLLRKWKGRCAVNSWEIVLSNFCFTYSDVDAWEVQKFGFSRCKVLTKLRILKNLLETQFDCYAKLKTKINEKSADELRILPLGRDQNGLIYWYFVDSMYNFHVYSEEPDDTEDSCSWKMIAHDKPGMNNLIECLKNLKPDKDIKKKFFELEDTCSEDSKSRSETPSDETVENAGSINDQHSLDNKDDIKENKALLHSGSHENKSEQKLNLTEL